MPTPPVDTPYCVHCGYDKAALNDVAGVCPECGHSVVDAYIPAMETPPRWWRMQRTGWRCFAAARVLTIIGLAILAIAMITLMIDTFTGNGSISWSGPFVAAGRLATVVALAGALVVVACGGVCCLAIPPALEEREHRRSKLFAGLVIIIPLLNLLPASAILFQYAYPREMIMACVIASTALIVVSAKFLDSRAKSFVEFTTGHSHDESFSEQWKTIKGLAFIFVVVTVYTISTNSRMSLAVFFALFTLISWLSALGRTAVTVRDELDLANRWVRREKKTVRDIES